MKSITLLLLLQLLSPYVILGLPFRDDSASSFVMELKKGENQLLVSVARMVDLIEENNGDTTTTTTTTAISRTSTERTLAIRFELDVIDKQIMFNDQPIELGISTFQVEAQIITKPNNVQNNKQIRIIQEQIDSGLVTIQVTAHLVAASAAIDDDLIFRRVEVKQDIIKINGEQVMQTNAGHQVIDMFDCGSFVKWTVDPVTGLPPPLPKDNKGKEWTDMVRGFIGGSLCTLFFGIVFVLIQFIRDDQIIVKEEEEEEEPPAYSEISIFKS